jgi:hypothetical protein
MKFSNIEKGVALLWANIFIIAWYFYLGRPTNIIILYLFILIMPILIYISIKYIITGLREKKK